MKMLALVLLVTCAGLYFWLGPGVARYFMNRVEVSEAKDRAAVKRQEVQQETVNEFVKLAAELDATADAPGKKPLASATAEPWPELEAVRPIFGEQTTGLMDERVDSFDRRLKARHAEEFELGEGVKLQAHASWLAQGQQEPQFFLVLTREGEEWRWLKRHQAQLLRGTESTALECRLETGVSGNGGVRETAWLTLPSEIVAAWMHAPGMVRVRLGPDEWELDANQQIAMTMLFKRWIAHGGDARPFRILLPPDFVKAVR